MKTIVPQLNELKATLERKIANEYQNLGKRGLMITMLKQVDDLLYDAKYNNYSDYFSKLPEYPNNLSRPIDLTDEIITEAIEVLRREGKLHAVKFLKSHTYMGLKESKELMDHYQMKLRIPAVS